MEVMALVIIFFRCCCWCSHCVCAMCTIVRKQHLVVVLTHIKKYTTKQKKQNEPKVMRMRMRKNENSNGIKSTEIKQKGDVKNGKRTETRK